VRGASAQEEYLCRATTLYWALVVQSEYYRRNADWPDPSYADLSLHTSGVQRIRDDYGHLQAPGPPFGVVTAAAPNRRAAREQGSGKSLSRRCDEALARRIDLILSAAYHAGHDGLVLGAWGCGVFGNDPRQVASLFKASLDGPFSGAFRQVHFAIPSRFDGACFSAFAAVLAEG
jgi:uncharacterized protein (TIGR02452 family)